MSAFTRFLDWISTDVPAAGTFDGTEKFPVIQSLATKRTTLQTIADWVVQTALSFAPSGTGAVARTAQAKLREIEVNLADFGTLGNSSTGDDAVWALAVNYIWKLSDDTGQQGWLVLPRGATYLAGPVVLGKNIGIKGKGLRFASQVIPLATFSGAALFNIDGSLVTGGNSFYCYFKDFIVDETNVTSTEVPIVFRMNDAYSCTFEDVYVRAGVGKLYEITGCNDIKIIRPRLFGLSTATCTHGIHAVSGSEVTVVDPDVELTAAGIQQDTDCNVTILGGYGERNTRAWYNNGNSSGSMTVVGGIWQGVNSGTIAAEAKGGYCTVLGGRYTANGGSGLSVGLSGTKPANVHFFGVSGDITDAKNWATTNDKVDPSNVHKTKVLNYKQVADNTATSIFRIVCPNATTNWGSVRVKISAKLTNSGFTGYIGEWDLCFSVQSGAIQTGTFAEVGTMAYANSANYSLSISMGVSNSIPNLDLQVTANSGGALGNGDTVEIMAEAELFQATDTGAVYLITQ